MNPPSFATFEPTRAAALARLAAVHPTEYARSRNAIDGAVSWLSPYITHGFVSLPEVLAGVVERHPLDVQHKFVYELGWRAYFRHVWQHRGAGILQSLHEGLLPESGYATELPADIREARTGVPVISAVQAPHHFHEHVEHRRFLQQHFAAKGQEAAQACLLTVAGLRAVDQRLAGL